MKQEKSTSSVCEDRVNSGSRSLLPDLGGLEVGGELTLALLDRSYRC